MSGIIKYVELTQRDLQKIEAEKTICLMSVSPIEVHGPHLPLGTDVVIAEMLQREFCKALNDRYPEYNLLVFPPLYAGCDALPVKGSISVRSKTLERLLEDYTGSLACQGFRYLVVCDNHGGPSHQIAMEMAARRAWKRYRFALINPFNVIFKKMVRLDPSFLEITGLKPGECGDDADCHAGTNETSLMLAANSDLVRDFKKTPAVSPPQKTGAAALAGWLGNFLYNIGAKNIAADLKHMANLLAWVSAPDTPSYLGSPGLATPGAGRKMVKGHVAVMLELVSEALSGRKPRTDPMLWWIRPFRK